MGRQLLFSVTMADVEMQTFTVGGHGGSGKDTSNTGVRLIHAPSGAIGEAREERSQLANKRAAFQRMAKSAAMQRWLRMQAAKLAGQPSVDELVEREMQPHKLRVETHVGGRWVKLG